MEFKSKFNFGDIVFLKTDRDQLERIITGVRIDASGHYFKLTCGTDETSHYEIEFTKEKDILKTVL